MRVLFVNPGRGLGGAEESLLLLLRGLRTEGIDPLVVLFGDGAFRSALDAHQIPHFTVRLPAVFVHTSRYRPPGAFGVAALAAAGAPGALRVAAIARRAGAALIHSNGSKAHFLAGVAGRIARRPVVWHLRDFPPRGVTGALFGLAARVLPSLILTNSHALASSVRRDGARAPISVVPIHNPIDLERYRLGLPRGRIRQELGITADGPLIGQIAHLTPWKGHELFLRIAAELVNVHPSARFVIVGGPIYETAGHSGYVDSLRRHADAWGLGARVSFLGVRTDVPDVLADLDVLVHCPTEPEPFGRVLAEAMATGCPVVAARTGGIPEVVEDGVTGLLVPPGDAPAFVSAVSHLLRDAALRLRFAATGRRRAETLFGIDRHVAQVLGAYRRVATPSRPQ